MNRVEPDGMVHDLYDGRFWPAEIEDEPFYNRSTILRVIDEEISGYGFGGEVEESESYHALMALRSRFDGTPPEGAPREPDAVPDGSTVCGEVDLMAALKVSLDVEAKERENARLRAALDEIRDVRSTILREGDLAISRAIAECDHNGERALRRFLASFKEVVE